MKNLVRKIMTFLLVVSIMLVELSLDVQAAKEKILMETVKENVPVWSQSTKNSEKVKTVKKAKTVLEVKGSVTNQYGNVWYSLIDGGYVYSGNVKEHVHSAALCGTEAGISYKVKEKEHTKIETIASVLCGCGYVMEKSEVIKTTEKHKYNNGVCECGIMEPHKHKGMMCAEYTVKKNIDGEYHYTVQTVLELCSCRAIVDEKVNKKKQKHEFEDGVCECGYSTKEKKVVDTLHMSLGMCGFASEPVATICDLADIVVSVSSGDVEDTVLSVSAAVVPFFTAGMANTTDDVVKKIDNAYDVVKSSKPALTYWSKTVNFEDINVYQRNDLFDTDYVSTWREGGITYSGTNVARMASGRAPIGYDGESVQLHHMTQRNSSSLAEVSYSLHKKHNGIIHINSGTCIPSGISRSSFDKFRERYWKERALEFME